MPYKCLTFCTSAYQTGGKHPSCSFGWKDTKWTCVIFPLPFLLLTTHMDFYTGCEIVGKVYFSPSQVVSDRYSVLKFSLPREQTTISFCDKLSYGRDS